MPSAARSRALLVALVAAVAGAVAAPYLLQAAAVPNTFADGAVASAAQVNANFQSVVEVLNGQGGGIKLGTDTGACTGAKEGTLRWNGADFTAEVCNGQDWVDLPGGRGYRYYRLVLTSNDNSDGSHNYLGGYTVFTGTGGSGLNLGQAVGASGYTIGPGSAYDPALLPPFITLTGSTSANDGRVRTGPANAVTGVWVELDVGSIQTVRSVGIVGRPNAATGHWDDVILLGSRNGTAFETIKIINNLGMTQNAKRFIDLP